MKPSLLLLSAAALSAAAVAAPEPRHISVKLMPHGKVRVATINGTTAAAPTACIYSVATGAGRTLVIGMKTRSAGPVQFVIEPEDGGAILFDGRDKGRDVSLPIERNARYEVRVFNDEKHSQAAKPTGYTLRIEVI